MGISESSFDYPPTNERRSAFQSRIKYTSKGNIFMPAAEITAALCRECPDLASAPPFRAREAALRPGGAARTAPKKQQGRILSRVRPMLSSYAGRF
jgi:hypothetical protein